MKRHALKPQFLLSACLLCVTSLESVGIDPHAKHILTPDSVGARYEELKIVTGDGFSLHTWMYWPEKENDKSTVLILAYPDKGNMSYWVYYAAAFAGNGFTVVTFDYRGFGKSSTFQVNRDFEYHTEFVDDLVAVAKATDKRFSDKRIGVWALSMGTIVTTRAMDRLKNNVDFVIGEGFVTNIDTVVQRIAQINNKKVILPEPASHHSKSLDRLDVPLLIFAATKDQITTSDDALQLQGVKKRCQVVTYDGPHLQGFQAGEGPFGEFYIDEVNKFLAVYF